jgi:serine/threonine-protein kinase HipA
VEDGCQALNLWPADKYNTTTEAVARALMNLTSAPLVAARVLLQQLTFAWISGNGDVHSKNLSVLTRSDGERRVSPAYDLPSTLPYGDTTLALSIGGHDTLSAARLRACAAELGVPGKSVDTRLGRMLARTATLADELRTSGLPFDRRVIEKAARQIESRRRVLEH